MDWIKAIIEILKTIGMVLLCLLASILLFHFCRLNVEAATGETYIDDEIAVYCLDIEDMYGIKAEILIALIETESSGQSFVTSSDGKCKGLCQVNPASHKDRMERLGVEDIYDPFGNILVAADYLMEISENSDYGDDIAYCLDVYNGNSKAKSIYESGKLSPYSQKILARAMELEIIHEQRRLIEDGKSGNCHTTDWYRDHKHR